MLLKIPLLIDRGGRQTHRRRGLLAGYAVLVPWCAFTLLIFAWLVVASFRTNQELYADALGLPADLQFANYDHAWRLSHIGSYFSNSLLIVLASVIIANLLAALAAYALARMHFPGHNLVLFTVVGGMGVPVQLLLVPLFMFLARLHLVGSFPGMILSYVAFLLPFTTFLLIGFFRTLPVELEEAAQIDGCSEIRVFWQIMFPLASPGLVTATIFNFVTLWNEYLLALVILTKPQNWTVSLGLYSLSAVMGSTANWVSLFAGIVIVLIPSMVLYVFLSERVIAGLTLGSTR